MKIDISKFERDAKHLQGLFEQRDYSSYLFIPTVNDGDQTASAIVAHGDPQQIALSITKGMDKDPVFRDIIKAAAHAYESVNREKQEKKEDPKKPHIIFTTQMGEA